ncbi:MAG: TM0106 family RecB-like putative nuclease, partial [Candidatus Hodarchaeales archaeon]
MISKEIFHNYLICKYKSYLKFIGSKGLITEFERFHNELYDEIKKDYFKTIYSKSNIEIISSNSKFHKPKKDLNYEYIFNINFKNSILSSKIDVLEKIPDESTSDRFSFIPILILPIYKLKKTEKLLLAYQGLGTSVIQKKLPNFGRIIFGNPFKIQKVHLNPLYKEADLIIKEILNFNFKEKIPRLILNRHCEICEFKNHCFERAKKEDELSLLRGLKEKEIIKLNKRGIFTVAQLSYTFRPRRQMKNRKISKQKHFVSLNALALRTNKVYIYNRPNIPDGKVKIYLDIEGDVDRKFFYLIGVVVDNSKSLERYSFWIEEEDESEIIINAFIRLIRKYRNIKLFHFGSYETKFFNYISNLDINMGGSINRIVTNSVNVLSLIYSSIYFPTYSNQLKDIAKYLGFNWTIEGASGLQSILWRRKWEKTKD